MTTHPAGDKKSARRPNWAKVLDFTERVSATFGAAFLGLALTTGVGTPKDLEAAAIAGALSAAKFAYVELNAYLKKPTA